MPWRHHCYYHPSVHFGFEMQLCLIGISCVKTNLVFTTALVRFLETDVDTAAVGPRSAPTIDTVLADRFSIWDTDMSVNFFGFWSLSTDCSRRQKCTWTLALKSLRLVWGTHFRSCGLLVPYWTIYHVILRHSQKFVARRGSPTVPCAQ